MNIKLYNAAIIQLRGRAMEALALIEMLLTDPTMVPDHSSLVEEIMKHSKALASHEAAMLTLQQYFTPKQEAPTPPIVDMDTSRQKEAPNEAPAKRPTVGTRDVYPPRPEGSPRRRATLSEEELMKRSSTLRKSVARQKRQDEKKKGCKNCKKEVKTPPAEPATIVDAVEVEEEKKDV